MDSYGQFCPVAQASEILTRRWMPLLIRELLMGSHRFNELHRGLPRISRTLLSQRLDELEEEGLIERRLVGDDEHPEYYLTRAGEELRPIVVKLGEWGKRWARREITHDDLDAGLLMWDMHRRIRVEQVPERRVVLYFHFTDAEEEHQHFWMILEDGKVDVCLQDPGFEEDLYIRSDVRTLTEVWMGDIGLARALDNESIWIGGDASLRKAFPDWLGLNMFAGIARERRAFPQDIESVT